MSRAKFERKKNSETDEIIRKEYVEKTRNAS